MLNKEPLSIGGIKENLSWIPDLSVDASSGKFVVALTVDKTKDWFGEAELNVSYNYIIDRDGTSLNANTVLRYRWDNVKRMYTSSLDTVYKPDLPSHRKLNLTVRLPNAVILGIDYIVDGVYILPNSSEASPSWTIKQIAVTDRNEIVKATIESSSTETGPSYIALVINIKKV